MRIRSVLFLSAVCFAVTGAALPTRASMPATAPLDDPRTIRAVFAERSYAPGDRALLTVHADVPSVRLRIFHAGQERTKNPRRDVMTGVPVTPARRLTLAQGHVYRVPIGEWKSGLYFARLEGTGDFLGFAPFVVRPRVLGASRAAVVIPTNTWQAYNFRDVDRDGVGDTWYADPRIPCVDLRRPYLHRGASPKSFRGFLRWFEHGVGEPTSSPMTT